LYPSYDPVHNILVIDFSSPDKAKYLGKTLILRNGDLHVQHSMLGSDQPLDLFVDNGNLYFDWLLAPVLLQ
jgi:hypothetical protein